MSAGLLPSLSSALFPLTSSPSPLQKIALLPAHRFLSLSLSSTLLSRPHHGPISFAIGKHSGFPDQLYEYILRHTREPKVLRELREETADFPGSRMQVPPDQGQFLAMLVQLMGAKRCIEVGVFNGYSSLAVALALPDEGRLVACDRDARSLDIARNYYTRAGVSHKVDIKHGLALESLNDLLQNDEAGSYDFAFLDADKKMYLQYYELLLQLIKPNGLIVVDNTLWYGRAADLMVHDKKTKSLRDFNRFLLLDERISISMIPVGDGMTLCRKR